MLDKPLCADWIEAARRVVSDYDTLMLTRRDFEAFAATMERPPKPRAALRKLMARP